MIIEQNENCTKQNRQQNGTENEVKC